MTAGASHCLGHLGQLRLLPLLPLLPLLLLLLLRELLLIALVQQHPHRRRLQQCHCRQQEPLQLPQQLGSLPGCHLLHLLLLLGADLPPLKVAEAVVFA
jgi:hypothetical protein